MRLRERDKRGVTVSACTGFDDDVYLFGRPQEIRAAIYPNERAIDAKLFGDKVRDMRLMLYDGTDGAGVKLDVGMGVSLDGGAPMYRIKSVEGRAHQTAVLELIPEGRRADGYTD